MFAYKNLAIVGAALLVLLGLWWGVSHHYTEVGKAEVQAKWEKDKVARAKAEELAIADRNTKNAQEKERQDVVNKTITEKYNEINNLRNELATAKRMRIGTAICSQRPSSPAKTTSPESSAPADTGAIVVREDVERDIRALMIRVEESFATGRACQAFIRENGFAAE